MKAAKFDGAKINKALDEFGSLDKALESMQKEKIILEGQLEQLEQSITKLKLERGKSSSALKVINGKFQYKQNQLQSILKKVEKHQSQYDLFEGFLAMIAGSPSVQDSLESLITTFQKLRRGEGWQTLKNVEELRTTFIRKVMGDFLKCYRCDNCGARFIVNRKPHKESFKRSYQCPACYLSYHLTEDDSFLKVMVSEAQIENVHRLERVLEENEALRPLKVFLDLPCDVCGKPITEWTDYIVQKGVKEHCWGHAECWNSDNGHFKQLVKLAEAELKKKIDGA